MYLIYHVMGVAFDFVEFTVDVFFT